MYNGSNLQNSHGTQKKNFKAYLALHIKHVTRGLINFPPTFFNEQLRAKYDRWSAILFPDRTILREFVSLDESQFYIHIDKDWYELNKTDIVHFYFTGPKPIQKFAQMQVIQWESNMHNNFRTRIKEFLEQSQPGHSTNNGHSEILEVFIHRKKSLSFCCYVIARNKWRFLKIFAGQIRD